VFVPTRPLDLIETLVSVGDRINAVLISSDIAWAKGLRALIAEEFPKIEQITRTS
jgi:hypothetical protein